ncbi:MAG TPA: hypothetical protein VJX47_10285 [Candidatus Sulfotelmatobacter sp.]|nr:hypothetical protein [Candidatus Sulfotelmatobacter sp.]
MYSIHREISLDSNIAAPQASFKLIDSSDSSAVLGLAGSAAKHSHFAEGTVASKRIDNHEFWGETPLQKHPVTGFDLYAG